MAVFSTTCDNFTGFDGSSPYISGTDTLTAGGSAGNPGGALTYGIDTSSGETSVRADYRGSNVRNLEFDLKVASGATLAASGDHTLVHIWNDSYLDFRQLRFDSDGTTFALKVVDPTASYATILDVPDRLSMGIWYRIKFQITDSKIIVRVNGRLAATLSGQSHGGIYLGVCGIGKFYDSIVTGQMLVDNVTVDVNAAPAAASTDADKLAAVFAQYKTNYIRADGCVIRPYPDGLNGSFVAWSDSVSEAVAYAMQFCVQMNDQTAFDSSANWSYNNMRRGAQGLGTVPYLYSWHWNIETNTAYDQNSAHDADLDIMKAYYWAHGRWGSGGTVNYLARANNIASDLYGLVVTNGALKYLPSDYAQSGDNPFELNPSYTDFVAMELADHYTSDDWQAVIDGMYDVLADARDHVYSGQSSVSGLPPDWCKVSTTGTITDGSRSNPGRYSYEAFRLMFRVKEHFDDYGDSRAPALMADAQAFLDSEWTTNGVINAEYEHDGDPNGAYEKTIFTFAAYQCLLIDDPSNATAADIYADKLDDIYSATVEGHIYQDGPGVDNYGYYDQSWAIYGELMRQGTLENYLPALPAWQAKVIMF